MINTIWINGRFLSRPVSGVERVASETLSELVRAVGRGGGALDIAGVRYNLKFVAPAVADRSTMQRRAKDIGLEVVFCGRFAGHVWEQFELPLFVGRDWLLNLCNTAPAVKRRQLVFIHDAGVWAIPHCYKWTFRMWYRALFRVLSWRGVGLMTNSAFSASELARYLRISIARISVASLGTDHMNCGVLPRDALSRLSVPDARFLLAVASQNPNKNFALIEKALALLGASAPVCIVVGQVRADVFSSSEPAPTALRYCGYVSDDELKALFDRATCLIYPSFYEGFGLPPLEAMARGCPVISSNTSALPETCGDAATYCDPTDPADLAHAMRELVDNPAYRDQMVERGRLRASRFRWETTAAVLLRVIETKISSA